MQQIFCKIVSQNVSARKAFIFLYSLSACTKLKFNGLVQAKEEMLSEGSGLDLKDPWGSLTTQDIP